MLLGVVVIVFRKRITSAMATRQVRWYGEAGRAVSTFTTPVVALIMAVFFILLGANWIVGSIWPSWPIRL